MSYKIYLPIILCLAICGCGNASDVRKPAVAGQFYPSDAAELRSGINNYGTKNTGYAFSFSCPSRGIHIFRSNRGIFL